MGLVTRLLSLPIRGPADGVYWMAGKLAEHVEAERNSPAALRAALAEAEAQLLSGALDEDAYDAIEDDLLARLQTASDPT